ncbi:MAG: iron-molybdenum cofactor biosynthesis protein [Thaumarchaeota archaeon]|nr:iron-molybdenum cofactor biosynthesis protein [Nitrososphaerota archaeon]
MGEVKIAIATDDGMTISPHLGRARSFLVVEVEDGRIKNKELRRVAGGGMRHGECDHRSMISSIKDCEAVISFGMGWRIYEDFRANGIKPIVTDKPNVEEALEAYLKGELVDRKDKLH